MYSYLKHYFLIKCNTAEHKSVCTLFLSVNAQTEKNEQVLFSNRNALVGNRSGLLCCPMKPSKAEEAFFNHLQSRRALDPSALNKSNHDILIKYDKGVYLRPKSRSSTEHVPTIKLQHLDVNLFNALWTYGFSPEKQHL